MGGGVMSRNAGPTQVRRSARPSAQAMAQPLPDDRTLGRDARENWLSIQILLMYGGVMLVGLLLFQPAIGIKIMWDVLIPVAPVLVTVAPGLWRNLCPMATFGLVPRNLGISLRLKMPKSMAAVLGLVSVIALFMIVPLRHICLNTNGPMTVVMLVSAAAVAALMGMLFEWRSGWCTSLCPIHPVEKLYGTSPALTLKNARCELCEQCTAPCPDSTPGMTPAVTGPSRLQQLTGNFLTGSFFGFVLGWFQVPDYLGNIGTPEIINAYAWPFGGAVVSYVVFKVVEQRFVTTKNGRKMLGKIFAAAAVSTYYWYRIPALTGFDPRSGLLYDVTDVLPYWFPWASHFVTTSFFFWFLVLRPTAGVSWLKRPVFAQTQTQMQAQSQPQPARIANAPILASVTRVAR